jgi:vacuolar-type H+-ATPase subunit H
MFEGIIEGYKKSYRWGYRQAKARYGKLLQQEREQLQEQYQDQLRQRDERIRQYQEEIRRLREK